MLRRRRSKPQAFRPCLSWDKRRRRGRRRGEAKKEKGEGMCQMAGEERSTRGSRGVTLWVVGSGGGQKRRGAQNQSVTPPPLSATAERSTSGSRGDRKKRRGAQRWERRRK
jgi:hypothetical protein